MPATWKTVRVFISSTFRDMQAERDHLVRFVFPKLREELVKYRIHLVDVDLRWGVTGDQDAMEVCREVIDECHPRFMCMLGGRYGWVPEGQDKSITADEIHYGVLGREAEARGHAFFYFRREADTLAIPDEVARAGGYREFPQPDEIERHGAEKAGAMARERAQKLITLKKAITDAGLPVFIYSGQWDTVQKRLAGLEAFGTKVHADLLQSLKDDPELAARFTDAVTATPDEFAEEADQMDAFIEERTDRFILGNRDSLMRDMLAFAAAEATPNIFVLTGEPGSGKSAFLAKFCRSLAEQSSEIHNSSFIIHHFVGASTGSTDLRRTLRRLCHELALAAGNTEPLPLDIKDLITHFHALLAEVAGRRRVILVFDALNQFDATDGAHWLNWLPRELPPGVRIVASVIASSDGQPEHQTLAILRKRPGTRMEMLEPLTEADALAVIEGSLRRYAKRLSPEQLTALLAKPAGRLPLYVLTALEELRTLGTYEEITERIRTLPGDARSLFGWILTERLARDPGFRDREGRPCGAALVGKFAACLGVSRHGLSPAELTALLDPGDPLGNVAALLRLLRPYLMRRGELLDFYHGQFREAAGAAHLDTPEKQRTAHQSVATCLQAFVDPHRDGQCRDAAPHALSELPHHQTHAEAWPDLIATLENIFFLESKVACGLGIEIAEDFAEAKSLLPLDHPHQRSISLIEGVFRREGQFIARRASDYPQALFQCLWLAFACQVEPITSARSREPLVIVPSSTPKESIRKWLNGWRNLLPGRRYLHGLCFPVLESESALTAILQADHRIENIAYDPLGRFVAAATAGGLRIWEVGTFALKYDLTCGEEVFDCLVFLRDGTQIFGGGHDGSICVWSIQTGELLHRFRIYGPLRQNAAERKEHLHSKVWALCCSPDGTLLGVALDGCVVAVDLRTFAQTVVALGGHRNSPDGPFLNVLCFSPDSRTLAVGGIGAEVRLYERPAGVGFRALSLLKSSDSVSWKLLRQELVYRYKNKVGAITCLNFSPSGEKLFVSNCDHPYIWSLGPNGGLLDLQSDAVTSMRRSRSRSRFGHHLGHQFLATAQLSPIYGSFGAFSPDGQHLAIGNSVGSDTSDFTILDIADLREVIPVSGASGSGDAVVAWAPSGETIAVSRGSEVRLYSLRKCFGEAGEELQSDSRGIHDSSLGESIDLVYVGPLSFADVHEQLPMGVVPLGISESPACGFERFVYSPSGELLAGLSYEFAAVWDGATGDLLTLLEDFNAKPVCAAFLASNSLLATGGYDKKVTIWDLATTRRVVTLHDTVSRVLGLTVDLRGEFLMSGQLEGGTLHVWRCGSWERVVSLNLPDANLAQGAFSDDGTKVAGFSYDQLALWEFPSGELLGQAFVNSTNRGSHDEVDSPDRCYKVQKSWDEITLTRAGENESHVVFSVHALDVRKMLISDDSTLLAICCTDFISVWEVAELRKRCSFSGPFVDAESFLIAPSNDWLAVTLPNGRVGIWSMITGVSITEVACFTATAVSLSCSSDASLLLVGSNDGDVVAIDVASWQHRWLAQCEHDKITGLGFGLNNAFVLVHSSRCLWILDISMGRLQFAIDLTAMDISIGTRLDGDRQVHWKKNDGESWLVEPSGAPIAILPMPFDHAIKHPRLPLWAGEYCGQLGLFKVTE